MHGRDRPKRRATILVMIVGLLASLFLIVTAYITLARFQKLALDDVEKGQMVADMLDSMETMILSALRQSLVDADGNVLAGGRTNPSAGTGDILKGYSPEVIPGYRGSRAVASLEPVGDCRFYADLTALPPFHQLSYYVQSVSSFEGTGSAPRISIRGDFGQLGLMLEDAHDLDPEFDFVDVTRNARQPFMDADGEGVPDSGFGLTRSLTQMANAVAGVPVYAPGGSFNPSAIPGGTDPHRLKWLRFDEKARFEVGVKVVDNGAMVALASPGDYVAGTGNIWNREFVAEMFNWIRYRQGSASPDDPRMTYDDAWTDQQLTELSSSAAAVEPLLRVRGGLLANYAEENLGALPGVLKRMRDRFKRTFRPVYPLRLKDDPGQRFNLASIVQGGADEWSAWIQAITLDPNHYNLGDRDPSERYVRRHLITTRNNSDELARVINPATPNVIEPGVYPGQMKFYLGDIARAFDANGYFVGVDPGSFGVDNPRGNLVIEQLADCFYEMLRDYDGWQDSSGVYVPTKWEAVTRREQAFMLAVNTVAFAAPRTRNPLPPYSEGFIDAVRYTDVNGPFTTESRTYVGYAPQPFITRVLAHCDGGTEPTGEEPPEPGVTTGSKALAIELYYPHDPGPSADPRIKFNNPNDPFALDLSQFAISVNPPTVEPHLLRLDQVFSSAFGFVTRWTGRNFATLSIDTGSNTVFRTYYPTQIDGQVDDLAVQTYTDPKDSRRKIDVKLWRMDSTGAWWVIDRLTVGDDPNERIPPKVDGTRELIWLVDYYRDTPGFEQHFRADTNGDGVLDPLTDRPARWGCVTNLRTAWAGKADPTSPFGQDVDVRSRVAPPSGAAHPRLGVGSVNPALARNAPSVPLYTMNASGDYGAQAPGRPATGPLALPGGFFTATPIHGAFRPKSFPTVGFMLFVPRFSHVTGAESRPMSEYLRRQWEDTKRSSSFNAATWTYPADFGHMAIFDNRQTVRDTSYFDNDRAGRIPWGLLVFDYFTTLDRAGDYNLDGRPDVDPLRVPGRININTAPWFVLAGLPVLNPGSDQEVGAIDHSASPAFWSKQSGVFVGSVELPDGTGTVVPRFDDPRYYPSLLAYDAQAGWFRVGPQLAQAAAGYRDRIRNVAALYPYTVLPGADMRNDPAYLTYAYRPEASGTGISYGYGPVRRGPSALARARGFLSLGELVNVYGFDSPVFRMNVEPPQIVYRPLGRVTAAEPVRAPDFFKAVSRMALLDTHFLTTRSNTFTVYVSVMDRENPQASIRSQLTVDRSNLLPKLVTDRYGRPIVQKKSASGAWAPIIVQNDGLPEIVVQRQIGYYNTQFDQ